MVIGNGEIETEQISGWTELWPAENVSTLRVTQTQVMSLIIEILCKGSSFVLCLSV